MKRVGRRLLQLALLVGASSVAHADIDWCFFFNCPPPPEPIPIGPQPGQGGGGTTGGNGGGGSSYPNCGVFMQDGSIGACPPPGGSGGGGNPQPQPPQPPAVPVDDYRNMSYPVQTLPNFSSALDGQGSYNSIRDSQGNVVGVFTGQATLPLLQSTARDYAIPSLPATDPIAADGEFTLEETDLTFAGFGIPFRFTRYYRSGVEFQSFLGWGWNHNFGWRLVVAQGTYDSPQGCSQANGDVFITTPQMTTVRFAWESTDGNEETYVNRTPSSTFRLHKLNDDPDQPWKLEDGSGSIYRFESQHGTLASVSDYAGHAIQLEWSRDPTSWPRSGGRLLTVTDTTGRIIHFNYSRQTLTEKTVEYTFGALQCLSLTADCVRPLVSFETHGALGLDQAGKPHEVDGVANLEVDLWAVSWPMGKRTSYQYHNGSQTTLPDRDVDTSAAEDAELACTAVCGDRESSCRNTDVCGLFEVAERRKCERLTAPAQPTDEKTFENYLGHCFDYCMAGHSYTNIIGEMQAQAECGARRAETLRNCQENSTGCEDWNCANQYRPGCYGRLERLSNQLGSCRTSCKEQCIAKRGFAAGVRYGARPALAHNLTRIIDGEGRLVVENRYGEEPSSLSFDKVIAQWQPNSVQRFTWFDFDIPERGYADDRYFPDPRVFQSLEICTAEGGARSHRRIDSIQKPRYVSVVHDAVGRVWTHYYNSGWQILRSINQSANQQQEYNFAYGLLTAVQHPSGARECFDNDDVGRPLRIVEHPAPGYPGNASPRETLFEYDEVGLLSRVVANASSARPSGTKILRDRFQRIVAMGEQVDTFRANWTCYTYADPLRPLWWSGPVPIAEAATNPPAPLRGFSGVSSSSLLRGSIANFYPVQHMFKLSGCATGLGSSWWSILAERFRGFMPRTRDVFPSTITYPDGSITRASKHSAGGPGVIERDAAGADPLISYAHYDDRGRWNETGRVLNGAEVPLVRRELDDTDQVFQEFNVDLVTNNWRQTRYQFDRAGNLKTVTTPEYERAMITNAVGDLLAFREQPRKTTDFAQSRVTCFNRDGNGRLIGIVMPEGNMTSYRFDPAGQLAETVAGYASFKFPWAARCKQVLVPITSIVGNASPRELVSAFQYDARGFVKGALVDGLQIAFTVDGFGRVIAEERPDGRHRVRGFDGENRLIWEGIFTTPPSGFAKPTALTVGMHAFAEYEYDLLGRQTKETHWRFTADPLTPAPDGLMATTTTQYDDAQSVVTSTDPAHRITLSRFNGLGRLISEVRAPGSSSQSTTTIRYSGGATHIETAVEPAPTATGQFRRVATLDLVGRVQRLVENDHEVVAQEFDALGQLKRRRLPARGIESFDYDAFGRLRITRQLGLSTGALLTRHDWDGNDRLQRVTDAEGHVTSFAYDGLARLSSLTDEIGTRNYRYVSGSNRLATLTLPSSATRTSTYDLAGRLREVTAKANGKSVVRTFSYDANDWIRSATQVGGGDSTMSLAYDSIGRLVLEHSSISALTLTHGYGDAQRDVRIALPGASDILVRETVDEIGRPTNVQLNGSVLATIQYEHGQQQSIDSANGTRAVSTYDVSGRLSDVEIKTGSNSIARVTDVFGPDNVRRLRRLALGDSPAATDLFTLDALGRLETENLRLLGISLPNHDVDDVGVRALLPATPSAIAYQLDGTANWLAKSSTPAYSATASGANRLSQVNGQILTYDTDGYLLSDSVTTYTWTPFGELASVTRGGETRTLEYDALGRRTRDGNGVLLWDGGKVLGFGSLPSGQIKIATESGIPLALIDPANATSPTYLHTGTDRSMLAVSAPDGALLEGYSYSAYGEVSVHNADSTVSPVSRFGNRFLYQGAVQDPQTLTMYLGHREYDAARGRFLSPDPIGIAGGVNLYAYVGGRPLSEVDLNGLSAARAPNGMAGVGTSADWVSKFGAQLASPNPDGTYSVLQVRPSIDLNTLNNGARYLTASVAVAKDLFSAYGWKLLVGDERLSRASTHLLHNMFGHGEPLTVPREWVMRGYENSYSALKENVLARAEAMANKAIAAGNPIGAGIVQREEHAGTDLENEALPLRDTWRAFDQRQGAAGADLRVRASFEWHPVAGHYEMQIVDVTGSFHDVYQWVESVNLFEFDAQAIGLYSPFEINGEWSDELIRPIRLHPPQGR